MGGNQRGIIRRALTFDWTTQASADREVPNLIIDFSVCVSDKLHFVSEDLPV